MLTDLLRTTRARTLALAAPLSNEDAQLQSMPDASPAKWHLAHTSWFFEALVLQPHLPGYCVFDERWPRLFNSYYESLGPRHARPQRGLLSRPSLDEVKGYRRHVDAALADLLPFASDAARALIELGCHHEQQHQELLLTDILHAFSCNPLLPAYQPQRPEPARAPAQAWLKHPGGVIDIGHTGAGFAFDNEGPRHRVLLEAFEISNRLVTCGEYADFVAAGGYREPLLWLSDGWATVQAQGWQRPLYWQQDGSVFGLHGVQALDPDAPVTQLSFYEACAFAEWAGARLPTEFEWEAASILPGFEQAADPAWGAWQWTRSDYAPYPGFKPAAGAVGEYNGKFMVGQQVLRGGSLATPAGHARPSYRNFFPPAARWQFSGLRLAR
ncbi:ergothioneine biosynthesis protein EgtB [Roseateles saccharophilus]|uniref:Ergothioneine biosynthesis protein EgtB n=1 Tax=Roseateles saccharophilus TaxID=304 RepID=A0A4R3UKE5_ROSSA|nr:ergothioneine biosynthesis protein EgtB [Roseateles saccharophilus]MDG0833949.1 ergothioneine biosynthesis protein EgtB [Roseateles saccharophilus]TCU91107.1 ergothioneine biosynthesis protein EgtB [Roseateles saccharophilus]